MRKVCAKLVPKFLQLLAGEEAVIVHDAVIRNVAFLFWPFCSSRTIGFCSTLYVGYIPFDSAAIRITLPLGLDPPHGIRPQGIPEEPPRILH
ncbi:hypothetical protein NQ318_020427 [Aromia moschata]|uniref:Uncharacterized protein n=1 Tax=Aromia moschata TaxID=1265417 RepID=A0AAV8YKB2_9CUCU|nr:hypothetical protein NQ318_020427 [Aromia moschata]